MKDEILIRYINKQCSPEDETKILEWLKEVDNRQRLFELEQIWGLKAEMRFSNRRRMDEAYRKLSGSLGFGKRAESKERKIRRIVAGEWLKYIAMLVIVSLLTANLFYLTKEDTPAYNTVVVPKGQRVSLLLSDGTKVWLNAESRLSYPTTFSEKNRVVKLEGEGYFEVAHNPECPFTVKSPMLKIRVLGTKFNAKAYRNEPSWITLKEGSVEVSTLDNKIKERMVPNDQVYYTISRGLVLIRNSARTNVDSWIIGDLRFDNNSLKEMAKTIERRYDMKIKIMNSALAREYFTCHFRKDLTINQVMELLKKTNRITYKIEMDTVYLYKNE